MVSPIDIELGEQTSVGSGLADEYVKELGEKLKVIHQVARDNEREYHETYKERYDKGSADTDFKPGTVVWLKSPLQTKTGESKKLLMRYNKLVYIKEKLDNNTYVVIDQDTHKQIDHPIHSDRLKKYYNEKDIFPTRIGRGKPIADSEDDESRESGDDTEIENKEENTSTEHKTEQREQQDKASEQNEERENKKRHDGSKEDNSDEEVVSKVKENKEDDRPWFDAEKLLATKMSGGKKYYSVKWVGDNVIPTWELGSDISEALETVSYNSNIAWKKKKE